MLATRPVAELELLRPDRVLGPLGVALEDVADEERGLAADRLDALYGMPILDADKAQHAIVIKRGMSPGFAGIENPLYYEPRTLMLFGDAKGTVQKLLAELKELG